ncbi:hypothetical protein [Paenirhodobacter populi]|nr:hypothetical protein [Sinirhodobacter populi]
MIFFTDGLAIRGADKPKGTMSHDMKNAELQPLTLLRPSSTACAASVWQ